jgi:hypothetical protein
MHGREHGGLLGAECGGDVIGPSISYGGLQELKAGGGGPGRQSRSAMSNHGSSVSLLFAGLVYLLLYEASH